MNKKAVIYVRSNGRENEAEIQEEKCKAFAEENNIEVVNTITDFSGVNDLDIDYVIVTNYDRVSHDVVEILKRISDLYKHDINLITVKYGIKEFNERKQAYNIVDKLKRQF